jgi:hypothetical protein
MSRLPRPHIPIAVRVQVADRQLGIAGKMQHRFAKYAPLGLRLKWALDDLFGGHKCELHHRPALVNRRRKRNGDYDPPANDPNYLVYLAVGEHDVETRIRGQHGQHSDLGMARKNKRIAKNRDSKRRKAKIAQREEYRWPSRPFPKRKKR